MNPLYNIQVHNSMLTASCDKYGIVSLYKRGNNEPFIKMTIEEFKALPPLVDAITEGIIGSIPREVTIAGVGREFKLIADAVFMATDIDDACMRISAHFKNVAEHCRDDEMDFGGQIEVSPVE